MTAQQHCLARRQHWARLKMRKQRERQRNICCPRDGTAWINSFFRINSTGFKSHESRYQPKFWSPERKIAGLWAAEEAFWCNPQGHDIYNKDNKEFENNHDTRTTDTSLTVPSSATSFSPGSHHVCHPAISVMFAKRNRIGHRGQLHHVVRHECQNSCCDACRFPALQ